MRPLELLAPAKNLACGIAAIDHGADAVYIGAPSHGARASASNSIENIKKLCLYAHGFGAKVHAAVNTIIYDEELRDTVDMIQRLREIGVDAFLIQDMGLLSSLSGTCDLHASTQCDIRTVEKVEWLRSLGFSRVVLARELSLAEISQVHRSVPDMELEVFVHGALCVSYSGVCYASQYVMRRSANRGECAQFCRLKFDLVDADDHEIVRQRHLLSLRDMCRIDHLERLADAGVSSFKIEGRLKDIGYVKNVVAAYSQRLDALVARRPQDYCRASRGHVIYAFTPCLEKTFNRGFTTYFLDGRQPDVTSFDTPKSMGAYVGKVKELRGNSFIVAGTTSFANGDGLCFLDAQRQLHGFRVNRVENNRLFPHRIPSQLRPGMSLYRNNDEAFEKVLSGRTACRRIPISLVLRPLQEGFSLAATPGDVVVETPFPHQEALNPQTGNIRLQLGKLGNTVYEVKEVRIEGNADHFFIPNRVLGDMRHRLIERLNEVAITIPPDKGKQVKEVLPARTWQSSYRDYPYLYNIANVSARDFYVHGGMKDITQAFEQDSTTLPYPLLMQCRHCIRYSLGYCVKHGGKHPTWREPLYLRLPDDKRFRLEFRCDTCQMNIYGGYSHA